MTAINMKEDPKPKRKTKVDTLFDRVNKVYDTGKTLGILMGVVDGLQTSMVDLKTSFDKYIIAHNKDHSNSRLFSLIQTLIIVICFAYLKWGK